MNQYEWVFMLITGLALAGKIAGKVIDYVQSNYEELMNELEARD